MKIKGKLILSALVGLSFVLTSCASWSEKAMHSHLRSHHEKGRMNRSIASKKYTIPPYTIVTSKTPVSLRKIQIDLAQKGVCDLEINTAHQEPAFECSLLIGTPETIYFLNILRTSWRPLADVYTLNNGERWELYFDPPNLKASHIILRLKVSPECTFSDNGCRNSIDYYEAQKNEVLKKIGKIHISLLGTFKR